MNNSPFAAIPEELRSFKNAAFAFEVDVESEALLYDVYAPSIENRARATHIPLGAAIMFSQLMTICQFRASQQSRYNDTPYVQLEGRGMDGGNVYISIQTSGDESITSRDLVDAMRYLMRLSATLRRLCVTPTVAM